MERGNSRLKFLDRWVGPVLLAVLMPIAFVRSFRTSPRGVSFGLLKTAAIGDTVLLSAIVSDIRNQNADAHIILFTGQSNFEFSKLLLGVDQVVRLPLTDPIGAVRKLRQFDFDYFIDFDSWPRISALLSFFSRASIRIGFRTHGQHRHFAYERTVEHRDDIHEIDNYRGLAKLAGTPTGESPQTFKHPWVGNGDFVIFHLWPSGTQSHLKEWASENWVALAQKLQTVGIRKFILTGGKEDIEATSQFLSKVPEELQPYFTSAAGSTFIETMRLLQSSALLVSVNTGIMHVGAAMGVPTVGLHGPTNPQRWGPIGPRVQSVLSSSPGAGTLNLGFEYQDKIEYMSGLHIDDVVTSCLVLLRS
jgi:ADP-heptose:LPS heptosyltransferase